MVSALERQREENLRRNRELLVQLGLDVPIFAEPAPAPKAPAKKTTSPPAVSAPKRRIVEVEDDDDEYRASSSPAQMAVVASGVRRSSRQASKPRVNYREDAIPLVNNRPQLPASQPAKRVKFDDEVEVIYIEKEGRAENIGNRLGTRLHDPRTYGPIPGVSVGTWWETRAQCSTDAVHAPWVSGISAGPQGAFSVALSGGYEDDVDLGAAFTFTGAGGRDLKGTPENRKNLRTAPQSKDQRFDTPLNAALKKSIETKNPVRVIRGYRLQSEWAPASGYRYDGLYRVEKAWMERGLNKGGFQVCKFALKRIDGQPPLPRRDPGAAAAVGQSAEDENGANEYDELEGDVDQIDGDSATPGNESFPDNDINVKKEATPVAEITEGACKDAEPVPSDSAEKPADLEAADSVDRTLASVSTSGHTGGADTTSKVKYLRIAALLNDPTSDRMDVDGVLSSDAALAFGAFAPSVDKTRCADGTNSSVPWLRAITATEPRHAVDSGTVLQESDSDSVGIQATEPAHDARESTEFIEDYAHADQVGRLLDLLDAEVRSLCPESSL